MTKPNTAQASRELTEEQILHLETIQHIENEVLSGRISNEQFFNNMDNLSGQFNENF